MFKGGRCPHVQPHSSVPHFNKAAITQIGFLLFYSHSASIFDTICCSNILARYGCTHAPSVITTALHIQLPQGLPVLQHWVLRCFASLHLLVMHLAVVTWLPGVPSLLHPPAMHGVMEALGVWHPQLVKGMLPVLLALVMVSPAT